MVVMNKYENMKKQFWLSQEEFRGSTTYCPAYIFVFKKTSESHTLMQWVLAIIVLTNRREKKSLLTSLTR